jgi:hypothetical protein
MTIERAPRRHLAASFPEITGIRLAPVGGGSTLVNLSSTGVLVECASRVSVGTAVTVSFEGTFTPSSVSSRVSRCEVSGITADGALRFHLGIAFDSRIALDEDDNAAGLEPAPMSSVPPVTDTVTRPALLRNRW